MPIFSKPLSCQKCVLLDTARSRVMSMLASKSIVAATRGLVSPHAQQRARKAPDLWANGGIHPCVCQSLFSRHWMHLEETDKSDCRLSGLFQSDY